MTYCVGILVREALVMIADTRTNAGIDNISTFRKLHVFETPGERVIALATSGNLSITQSVVSFLMEGLEDGSGKVERLTDQPTMFKVAQFVGRAIREVHRVDARGMEAMGAAFDVQILLGGQIKGGRLQLFNIYAAGNFIEVTPETPFFQIGEHKYGKPILDRAVSYETDAYDALKIGLISMDSTMRSNLSVGLPIDVLVLRRDALAVEISHRIEPGEPYFTELRESWSTALRRAHMNIGRPPYGPGTLL